MSDTLKLFCHDCMIYQTPIDMHGQLVCHVCKKSVHNDAEGHNRHLEEQRPIPLSESSFKKV